MHVVQTYSGEQGFDLVGDGATQGALLSTVSMDTTYDNDANVNNVIVTSKSGLGTPVKIVDTINTYITTGAFTGFEGRLNSTVVKTTHNGVYISSQDRKSTFDYYTTGVHRGLLWHETIEPNDSNYTLQTTHSYDSFGNLVGSSTAGGGITRCTANTVAYDGSGRYADTTFDCLGRKLADVTARNSFGSPTTSKSYLDVTGSDYVTTVISYSVLGREYYRYQADGSYATKYLTLDLSFCPSGTAYKATSSDGSGAAGHECFDLLGRSIRTMSKGFDGGWDGQDTEYDQFGRVKRKSEPFDLISGGSVAPYWTTLSYDLLGRVMQTVLPDGSNGSTTYFGLTTVTTNDLGQSRTEVNNVLGEVTDVTDNIGGNTQFSYDHQGNMTSVIDSAGNETTIEYDLLGRKKKTTDPDKGIWTYDYNFFGELILQTDANSQTQTMTYDDLGRMVTRVDTESNGTTIEGSTVWTYDSATYGFGQLDNVTDTQSGYMRAVLYDSLGRATETITNFDGGIYYEKTTFDQIGRVFQVFDAAGDGSYTDQGIVNGFNANGYLESVSDAVLVNGVPRTTYRQVAVMNARGQVTTEYRGIDNQVASPEPSVTTISVYSASTGRLLSIDGFNDSGLDVQDLDYSWDTLGNLTSRQEMSGPKSLSESFLYDGLNRLTSQDVSGQSTVTVTYDGIGNITNKSDVGTYTYGAGGAGPHAVTSAGGTNYTYDLNGNNKTGDGRTIQYTTFDKPDQISKGGHITSFAYGPDHTRYRRVDDGTSGIKTTRYIGNVEIIFQANGDQDRKRYIAGIAIETIHFGSNSVEDYRETHYLHLDHLGSLDVITDSTGAVVQEQSFDAWGQRRNAIDWTSSTPIQLSTFDHSLTTRGFTGHEMLDEVGIIHMNGRIYDAKLGRFLQADPFIQDPMNTQSLNRYSYLWNNPLNATDPSGHFVSLLVGAILAINGGVSSGVIAAWVAAAAVTETIIAGGDFKDALLAGLSAAAFAGLGADLAALGGGVVATTAKVVAFGWLGGMTDVLQGGTFGNGFKSAGIGILAGAAAGAASSKLKLGNVGQGVARMVAAGTASELTGGKFVNGAASVAFSVTVESIGRAGANGRISADDSSGGTAELLNKDSIEKISSISENFESVFTEGAEAFLGATSNGFEGAQVAFTPNRQGVASCVDAACSDLSSIQEMPLTAVSDYLRDNPLAVTVDGIHQGNQITLYPTSTTSSHLYYPEGSSQYLKSISLGSSSYARLTGIENVVQTLAHETGHQIGLNHGNAMRRREWSTIQRFRRE